MLSPDSDTSHPSNEQEEGIRGRRLFRCQVSDVRYQNDILDPKLHPMLCPEEIR